ncbi:hypothetical protein M431DRAFT_514168 [Trichoderma harzianum CBS 226.95]|uniref:Bacteriophage T5 Orf172 DNA-binding domain-containing protein n=1 Tax=Trichoderma harzianum CBS 226.95 TaxID=983964 RepID=A0A2T3ZSN4_TRIHA|nr:hypothetical protein M431DRAFT_514168 [Trichoderma harzianum CBS 226.95]PTB47811.1 hypothetical protein M431DRAFT_514168 [Trichoderma harzianum CBS 226.95]
MSEFPDTESFYDKMETFITYSHCKRWHRQRALDAFAEWKRDRIANKSTSRQRPTPITRQRVSSTLSTPSVQSIGTSTIQPITAAALQLVPSVPTRFVPSSASATSDDGSSFVDSIAESRSVSSNTTFMSSLPNTPQRNGAISRFNIEDVAEEESVTEAIPEVDIVIEDAVYEEVAAVVQEVVVKEETVRDNIIFPDIRQEDDTKISIGLNITISEREESHERDHNVIKGLGITGIQRSGSIRDHSPVFQVISCHPTPEKMKEGVVYILEHQENPSLFKIGWSSKSAEERSHQPNNCYGINTKIIYETKRFIGAPQAERIAQVILRHANIRVLECFNCQGGHREWFIAPRETVRETVMHVEEFLQMPAYTLQNGEYKLSPEAYDRVVKQMCNFSVTRLGELMRGPKEGHEETETIVDTSIDTILTPLAQITDEPEEISRPNTSNGLSEIQEVNKSLVSISSHETQSQKLSAGVKLARKVKRLFSVGDSVKTYLLRPRGSKLQPDGDSKRPFGSRFVDLKDKARDAGTKVRHDAREFRRDFREELHRKSEEQTV